MRSGEDGRRRSTVLRRRRDDGRPLRPLRVEALVGRGVFEERAARVEVMSVWVGKLGVEGVLQVLEGVGLDEGQVLRVDVVEDLGEHWE